MNRDATLLPLTHPQLRIWYIEKLYPNTCIHNIGGLVRIQGNVDMECLQKAIHAFLWRNVALRLQLIVENGEVRQYLSPAYPAPLRLLDFRELEDSEKEAHEWVQQEFTTPFVLLERPLYEFALVRIDEHCCGYFVKLHHVIADGWSIQLMTDQICSLYERFLAGEACEGVLEEGYLACIEGECGYLHSARFQKDRQFWLQRFRDLPETYVLPGTNDLSASRKLFIIDDKRTTALRSLARQKKWSLNTIFVSGILAYLYQLQQRDDLIIGLPVFNRRGTEKKVVGMFTSTMPFRMRVSGEKSVEELHQATSEELMKSLFHQKYPYNLLVQDLGARAERVQNLFQVCVNYYNTKPAGTIAGHVVENLEWFNGMQVYALQVVIKDWMEQGTLQLMFDFKKESYTTEQIERLFGWLLQFIDILLQKSDTEIQKIDMLSQEEKKALLYDRNETMADYPQDQPIQQLFEEQVLKTPRALALQFEGQRLTYDELNRRANQLARTLRQYGVKNDVVVGILANHSIELIVGIWGIIKAGGAYLPLAPAYPVDRIDYMLADSGAHMLLTNQVVPLPLNFSRKQMCLSDKALYQGEDTNIPLLNRTHDLVYVIYTSGSTGRPKGIMLEHRALINYIWWAKKTYLSNNDRYGEDCFALYSSIAFDLTMTSIFTPLISGNKIVIYQERSDEFVLQRIVRENQCTIIKVTPSHLALLSNEPLEGATLRCLIVGGEDFRVSLAHALWKKYGGQLRIFNEYGPTEATIGCMIHEYQAEDDTGLSVPIGKPINNMQVYLLTDQFQPVPEGEIGELFVAGEGLARGYISRGDLTAEKFLPNPFQAQGRMYRTGDLARFQNGILGYLGRIDDQAKLHGYRIEPAEVEGELLKHEVVRQAVVVLKTGPGEHKYLAAFVQLRASIPLMELKRFLAQRLPAFMIPVLIVEWQQFALTLNGKIDRRVLEILEESSLPRKIVPVDQQVERHLLHVVKDVLQVDEITGESNSYFLGMDSIKAIQVASRLNDLGYQVKAQDVLTYPVIQELALILETAPQDDEKTYQLPAGYVGLTPTLAWFKRQKFECPDFWHQSLLLTLPQKREPAELNRALQALIQHHDTLRLNYDEAAEDFFYNSAYLAGDLQVVEVVEVVENSDPKLLSSICAALKARIRLADGLLFRAFLLRIVGECDRLLLVAHHVVIDGVSWRIILEDLHRLLRTLEYGELARLSSRTTSVQAWAAALQDYQALINQEELAFWQHTQAPWTVLPADRDGGPDDYSHQGIVTVELPEEETHLLFMEANQAYNTQVNDLLVVSLALTLARILRRKEIVVELEAHGRHALFEHIDVSRTVGWFTALFPIRLHLQGEDLGIEIPSIRRQLGQIPHKGIGFGVLTNLANNASLQGKPGIRFNYLGEIDNGFNDALFNILLDGIGADSHPTNHLTSDIEMIALIHHNVLSIRCAYSINRYMESTIVGFIQSFLFQLRTVIAECCEHGLNTALLSSELPVTEEELSFLLED